VARDDRRIRGAVGGGDAIKAAVPGDRPGGHARAGADARWV